MEVAAGLERAGRDVPVDAGQRPAPEESARTQDRCHGCRVDCAVSAMWVAARQLCATGASEAVAVSDPAADEAASSAHGGGQPDTQGAGAGQHQGVVGGLRSDGRAAGERCCERCWRAKATRSHLAELARGRLREKRAELVESLEGHLNEHQRWLLGRLLGQVEFLEQEITAYDARLREVMRPFDAARAAARYD